MKMRSYNFCHTNTKNPGNNLGIFCLITGRPKLNGYQRNKACCKHYQQQALFYISLFSKQFIGYLSKSQMTPIKKPMALISKPTGCALKKLFHSLRFHILIILRLITTVLTKVTKRKSRRPRKTVGRNDGSEMSGKRSVSTSI